MKYATVTQYQGPRKGRCNQLRPSVDPDSFFMCVGMAVNGGYCMRCQLERMGRLA